MKNKGFTLIELLGVILVLAAIFVFSVPIVLSIIDYSKKSAFKNSAISMIDSVEYYIANHKFENEETEIDVHSLGNNLKNNNFDEGIIKKREDGKFEIIYLKQGNFCAKGTEEDLKVSDSGCGPLDETEPNKANLVLFNSTSSSIEVLGIGHDIDSEIIKYEFSIDGKKYVSNEDMKQSIYNFENITTGEHTFKLRVTNEAGKTKESEEYHFSTSSNIFISCELDKSNITSQKILTCNYPIDKNYTYQYAFNGDYTDIDLKDDKYQFTFDQKGTFYTRILNGTELVAQSSIRIDQIDSLLNDSTPVLAKNMIPVVYDEQKGSWIKADPKKIYWDYENKIWANAVIVRKDADSSDEHSKSREFYLSDNAIGEPIYEKDLLGYYVWIPRFAYNIWNVNGTDYQLSERNGERLIDVIFENKYDKSYGMSNGLITNNNYYTHPAFTFGEKEISGFWISKYQMSLREYTECYKSPSISTCNKSSDLELYSLPNVSPIRYISISSAYLLAKNMSDNINIYGINDMNTHLVKNTEWGAVAYLSHSIYGNDSITDENNTTTGNVYGVYNTNSIYNEMVMGNYNSDPGTDYDNQSGFIGLNGNVEWPDQKYYDLYTGTTSKGRILGDATGETEGWYSSKNEFVNGTTPFFVRGGNKNKINNIFNYSSYSGGASEDVTFRVVFISKNV